MKKTNSISINILSVFVILICLLLICVDGTNSWFTSQVNNVHILVDVGTLKLSVYQNIDDVQTKLLTDEEDIGDYNGPTSNYVVLDKMIAPDEEIDLVLTLSNEDSGSSSMYVRYRFEIYSRGVEQDTKLDVEINDYTAPVSGTGAHAGFVWDESTEWYYYKNETATANALFAKNATAKLMESFTIPYSSFMDVNGDMIITNSNTIYIKLIVDASVYQNFSE